MLPRLQAEERLSAITGGAIAAGTMDRSDQEEIVAALREAADIAKPKAAKASPLMLAGMGIAVSGPLVPSEEGPSDG